MSDTLPLRPLMAGPKLDEPLALDQNDAARLSGLSAKTLERLAAAGEQVGRIKIGRRVLYHRATLAAWLARKAASREGDKS